MNAAGNLGVADDQNHEAPVRAAGGNWAGISAGGTHTVAVARDGAVSAWGGNDHGQLGIGSDRPTASGVVRGVQVRRP
jgi:alpha-tubulin suppressor-like RCC1 family protein